MGHNRFIPPAADAKPMTAVDDDFEGLQPGDNAKISISATIAQPPVRVLQAQPSTSAQKDPKTGVGVVEPKGKFCKSYEQFLETKPEERRSQGAFEDEDDEDDEEMVSRDLLICIKTS